MKKLFWLLSALTFIAIISFWQGCNKSEDVNSNWSAEDKASYEQAINVQDQAGDLLDGWFQTMDSVAAINKAKQYFEDDPSVSQVTVNSQGISVQYANGMRGGLFLNPKDDKSEAGTPLFNSHEGGESDYLKSLVNKKKMILINPHYFERSQYTDQIYSISGSNLQRVDIDLSTFYKNGQATIDRFTELAGYGVIQIYSHGWAWPKETNITDVYLLTGETANEATSSKYWDELKTGNIPVVKIAGPNKYFVSPKFIKEHNDFSNDTVLFFGGFCYSFLGDWPDVIDGFADGAYLGYDWSVYTYKNANWSVNLLALMSKNSEPTPITVDKWMNDASVEKSYWNEKDNRTVHIHYTGDGTLKLWQNATVSASILALSVDGAPISVAGEKNTSYNFKCNVSGLPAGNYSYTWNKDDGSNPVTVTNDNTVSLSWPANGSYTLSVLIKNTSTGNTMDTASTGVSIGLEGDIFEFLHSLNKVKVGLQPGWAIYLSDGSHPIGTLEFYPDDWNISGNIQWSGNIFNLQGTNTSGDVTMQISGTLSEDGRSITSITATRTYSTYQLEAKVTFTGLDTDYSPGEVDAWYRTPYGSQPINHVTTAEYKKWNAFDSEWITLESIDWDEAYPQVIFYKKD